MGLLSRVIAALVGLAGTSVFISLLVLDPGFRMSFWNLTGENMLYTGVGLIAVFASIIALSNWLWTSDF
jgi:hypothetical protein